MFNEIMGLILIAFCVFGVYFSILHLKVQMQTPKDKRLWYGVDVVMQLLYPVYAAGIAEGIYLLTL